MKSPSAVKNSAKSKADASEICLVGMNVDYHQNRSENGKIDTELSEAIIKNTENAYRKIYQSQEKILKFVEKLYKQEN